jgi:hypothetical protein
MYKNRTILRGSDAYTSKQCGARGCINDRLGYVQHALTSQTETSMRLRAQAPARNMLLQLINRVSG